jgi:hypothetical protein
MCRPDFRRHPQKAAMFGGKPGDEIEKQIGHW